MKIYQAYKEREGVGFKILFPTAESLRDQINSNPKTREEAIKNKEIQEQIRKLVGDNEHVTY